mgnify:CR=1 FL=1
MRIRRILLENFGSHQRTELTFTDGINAIIGSNGAGKTTILEAISYALYHKTTRSPEDLIRKGSSRMRVDLEFEVGGKKYLVRRERSDKGEVSAELYEISDGGRRTVQRDQTKVSLQIESIIGLSRDVFQQSVYVRQGEIQELLESVPSKRKEIVGRLLGIDILEKIWEELKEVLDRLNFEISSLEREISSLGDLDKERILLRKQIESTEEELIHLNEEISSLKKKLNDLKRIREELEERSKEFVKLRSLLDEVRKKIESSYSKKVELESNLREIEEELSRAPYLEELSSKFEDISKLRDKLRRLLDVREKLDYLRRLKEELGDLEREISEIEGKKTEIESLRREVEEKRKLRDELIKLEVELRNLMERKSEEEERILRLEDQLNIEIEKLERVMGEIPREPEEIIEHYSRRVGELEESVRNIESDMERLKSEMEGMKGRIRQQVMYLEEISGELDRCPLCKSPLSPEKIDEIRRELSRSVEFMENRLSEIDKELKRLDADKSLRESLLRDLMKQSPETIKKIFNELAVARDSLESLKRRISIISNEFSRIKGLIGDLNAIEERYRKLQSDFDRMELLKQRAIRVRDELIQFDQKKLELEAGVLEDEVSSLSAGLGINLDEVEEIYARSKEAFIEYEKLKGLLRERDRIINMIKEVESEMESYGREAMDLEERIASLGFDEGSLERVKLEIAEIDEKLGNLIKLKGEHEGKLDSLREREKELESKYEKLRELRAKKEKLDVFRSKISKVRDLFSRDKGIQLRLREMARPVIEREINEIFSSFNFDYDSIQLTDDFTPVLKRSGREYPFESLSGGERVALALALRLAIARYLVSTNIESFLLDEPTVHLDDERIDSLLEALSSLQVPQVIVVTHSPRFRDIASRCILVNKSDGISKIEVLDDAVASD